jgi:hypothetical protein
MVLLWTMGDILAPLGYAKSFVGGWEITSSYGLF